MHASFGVEGARVWTGWMARILGRVSVQTGLSLVVGRMLNLYMEIWCMKAASGLYWLTGSR